MEQYHQAPQTVLKSSLPRPIPFMVLVDVKNGFGRDKNWTCILISCSTNEQIQTMKVSTLQMIFVDPKKGLWPWQDLNLHPHGGSRTRNLLLRRLAPYPLGHMVLFQWATRPSNKPRQMQTMEMSLLQHSLQTRRIKQWFQDKNWKSFAKRTTFCYHLKEFNSQKILTWRQ